jgi:hypothetical protein
LVRAANLGAVVVAAKTDETWIRMVSGALWAAAAAPRNRVRAPSTVKTEGQ